MKQRLSKKVLAICAVVCLSFCSGINDTDTPGKELTVHLNPNWKLFSSSDSASTYVNQFDQGSAMLAFENFSLISLGTAKITLDNVIANNFNELKSVCKSYSVLFMDAKNKNGCLIRRIGIKVVSLNSVEISSIYYFVQSEDVFYLVAVNSNVSSSQLIDYVEQSDQIFGMIAFPGCDD